jgi:hypothetical protein
MFHVKAIAEDGSTITLVPYGVPLGGAIVGRQCPDFSYDTEEGETISRETLKGRAFLIDIWSFT